MKTKQILYWTTTLFIALETLVGGVIDLVHGRGGIVAGPTVVEVVTSLGYPVYVLAILGVLKIPAAIVLVVPGLLRLKEWAYAGIVFELLGAAASQTIRGHAGDVLAPAIMLGLALASWALRPADRVLGNVELISSPIQPHGRDQYNESPK